MKTSIIFTGTGPILIMTSYESLTNPDFVEKLAVKGIKNSSPLICPAGSASKLPVTSGSRGKSTCTRFRLAPGNNLQTQMEVGDSCVKRKKWQRSNVTCCTNIRYGTKNGKVKNAFNGSNGRKYRGL